jgi:hypothetical protein
MKLRVLAPCALLPIAMSLALPAAAAPKAFTYTGGGLTLTLSGGKAPYGSTLHGSLTVKGTRYRVLGDWIPAGDAGGDLLRFYGHPFPGNKAMGLVGVATLYSTCNPNCAAATTYNLHAIGQFQIPGTKAATVKVTLRM